MGTVVTVAAVALVEVQESLLHEVTATDYVVPTPVAFVTILCLRTPGLVPHFRKSHSNTREEGPKAVQEVFRSSRWLGTAEFPNNASPLLAKLPQVSQWGGGSLGSKRAANSSRNSDEVRLFDLTVSLDADGLTEFMDQFFGERRTPTA